MACCNAMFERCAPNGDTVIGILDAEAGTTTYRNPDGTPYIGDVTLLGSCSQTGAGSVSSYVDNDDGSFTLNSGDGSTPVIIPVCDLLDDLTATGEVLPAGVTVLGSDCQWHQIPESECCFVTSTMIDPATGDPVIVVIDTTDGTTTYFDSNGQPWTGDPSTLTLGGGGGDGGSTPTVVDNGDGSFSHNPGDGTTPTVVAVCDLLDDLVDTTVPLPDGLAILGADCQWHQIPDSECCFVSNALIDPATGDPVIVVIDTTDGTTQYLDSNGQPWTGDPATLTLSTVDAACSTTAGGLTGTPSGAFTDGCTIEAMSADFDPETNYPAAGFPEGWRQLFSGGITGTETWTIQNDTNGVPQWHQIA